MSLLINLSILERLHITWECLKMLNLGFHKPKKDQCLTCNMNINITADENQKNTDYEEYISDKNLARLVKQNFKKAATIPSKNKKCFVFYMQKVVQTLLHLIKQNCLLKTFLRTLILMTRVSLNLFSLLELIRNRMIFLQLPR